MTPRKLDRAFALAGITLPTVRAHIERNLAAVAGDLQTATVRQLAAVIAIHHTAYMQGRASAGAAITDDAVWIGAGVDQLVPLAALRKIEVTKTTEPIPAETHSGRNWPASQWSITRYTMDYTERV